MFGARETLKRESQIKVFRDNVMWYGMMDMIYCNAL